MMRLKVDENLHDDIASLLISGGHDVETVFSEGMRGCADKTLAANCRSERRALLTLDLDFADIRTYPPQSHAGIIVLRVSNQSRAHVLHVVKSVSDVLQRESLEGRLWIASEAGVRIRGT